METEKAKEFVEGGIGLGLAFGEALMALADAAVEQDEISPIEHSKIRRYLYTFEGIALQRYMQNLRRGNNTDQMCDVINDIDNRLRSNPMVAIDSLICLTTPEAINMISTGEIPAECTHILKSLGWQRPSWTIEKMEQLLIWQARKLTGKDKPRRRKK